MPTRDHQDTPPDMHIPLEEEYDEADNLRKSSIGSIQTTLWYIGTLKNPPIYNGDLSDEDTRIPPASISRSTNLTTKFSSSASLSAW